MSPEDVRMIVDELLPQLKVTQMTTFITAGVLGLLGGTVGAFGGAYFKKRGENKANDAHFDRLSKQLKKNTEDTEWIKTSLSGNHWVGQQRWVSKEKYYTNLITNIANWSTSIVSQMNFFEFIFEPHEVFERENDKYIAQERSRGRIASDNISELRGPILVFLSEKTSICLDELSVKLFKINDNNPDIKEQLKMIHEALKETLELILNEAKLDLNKPLLTIDAVTRTR